MSARRPRSAPLGRGRTPPQGYGRPNSRGNGGITSVIQPERVVGGNNGSVLAERAEALYESNRKEPLGRPASRGLVAPKAAAMDEDFRFGVRTAVANAPVQSSNIQAFAPDQQDDEPEVHKRYVKSHFAFGPGEQVNRNYEWPAKVADPRFAFGRPGAGTGVRAGNGVQDALLGYENYDTSNEVGLDTRIVSQRGESSRRSKEYPLGRCKPPLAGAPCPAGYTFGKPSGTERTTAADLIRGMYSQEEQRPDRDLGRCVRYGRRNYNPEGRTYGRASSRPATAPGAMQGEEVDQKPVFRPPSRGGVERKTAWDAGEAGRVIKMDDAEQKYQAEFAKHTKTPEQTRQLFADAGHPISRKDFIALWEKAHAKAKGREVTMNDLIAAYAAAPLPQSGRLPGT